MYRSGIRKVIDPTLGACKKNPNCLSDSLPLLQNVRRGLIDPDTPQSAMWKTDAKGKKLKLVVCSAVLTMSGTWPLT